MKNFANMHRKHDVKAFSKHRPKHRRALFLSKHRLNIASLRIGKHRIVKNIASLRKVNIAHPYQRVALPEKTNESSRILKQKKLKEIPSRHFLENLPEKASMYAFIHLKLIGNLQGFCQYIMADMPNHTIADYRKYSAVVFLGPKNSFL